MRLLHAEEEMWFYIYSFQETKDEKRTTVGWFSQRHCLRVFSILAGGFKDDSPKESYRCSSTVAFFHKMSQE